MIASTPPCHHRVARRTGGSLQCLTSLLLLVGVLLAIVPAHAAEPVPALPDIAQPRSARLDGILLVNSVPIQWGQGVVAGDRFHVVIVVPDDVGVAEIVAIGRRVYVRFNDEPRWQAITVAAAEVPAIAPTITDLPLTNATIMRVGDALVNNAATTQYQVWIDVAALLDPAGLTAVKADVFIGTSDAYLHKYQFLLQGTDPEFGQVVIEGVFVYSAFNAPVAIGPPPDELVDDVSVRAAHDRSIPGVALLPHGVRPLVAERLHIP
jgi:hypothetical protein